MKEAKRIRTNLDIAEDIGRIIAGGLAAPVIGAAAGANVALNAVAEILENIGYVGVNGCLLIGEVGSLGLETSSKLAQRGSLVFSRGIEDMCSFFYRALSNKEQLVGLHKLEETKKNIDDRLNNILPSLGEFNLELESEDYPLIGQTRTTSSKISASLDGNKITIKEEKTNTTRVKKDNTQQQEFRLEDIYYRGSNNHTNYSQIHSYMAELLKKDHPNLFKKHPELDWNKQLFSSPEFVKALSNGTNNMVIKDRDKQFNLTFDNGLWNVVVIKTEQHKSTETISREIDLQGNTSDLEAYVKNLQDDIKLYNEKEHYKDLLFKELEKKTATIEDKDQKNTCADLCRDYEAYKVSKRVQTERLQKDESLKIRNFEKPQTVPIEIPKTTYGISMAQEAAKSVSDSLRRLMKDGGKADKTKTFLEATSEREQNNESTLAKIVKNPLGTVASPITYVTKSLSRKKEDPKNSILPR